MRFARTMATLLVLASAPAAAQPVSHAAFDRLLHAHVRSGLVDYDAFARSAEFQGYLRALGAANPAGMSRDDQLAYWINSYNAFTIQLVNKHGERESIRNINRTLGIVRGYGPWNEPIVRAGGRTYTLDHVEQEILRKRLREPRIHFALVCAARGCPPLRGEAYTGARIEEQLDDQARLFLARTPAKNRVDVANRTLYASRIFEFRDYERDFGGTPAAIGRYIARYLPDGAAKQLLLSGDFRIRYTPYDWSLNSQPR
jgi:hypothetical protein